MNSLRNKLGALSLLAVAAIYGGFTGILIRQMSKSFSGPMQVVLRFSLAFVLLIIITAIFCRSVKLQPKERLKTIGLGVFFGLNVLLFTYAVNNTTLSNSAALTNAGSIITLTIVGQVAFNEKPTRRHLAAITLALVGVAAYLFGINATLNIPLIAAIFSGVFSAIAGGFRKSLRKSDGDAGPDAKKFQVILKYQFGFGCTALWLYMPFSSGKAIHDLARSSIIAGLIFAVLLIVVGNLLLFGQQSTEANVGGVILSTELAFAVLAGWILYDEIPHLNEAIGGICIIWAALLSSTKSLRLTRHA